jgi:DNA-binding response OmpR family regulator
MSAYVLILDDDEAMRELLEITLSGEGYDVRSAASSDEALASAAQQQPRVILFDLTLGNRDGESFVRAYRQLSNATACLIVVSGAVNIVERAAEMSVDGYLVKPYELDDLLATVAKAFSAAPK